MQETSSFLYFFLIMLIIVVMICYVALAIFLTNFSKKIEGKPNIMAWIPFSNIYLLGKLTFSKDVGYGLLALLILSCTLTLKIDRMTIILSLPSLLQMILGAVFAGAFVAVLIFGIRKYDRLKNENVFASLFAEKSLEEIYAILNDVVEGNILFQDNNISLQSKKFNKPININNLSTGLKAFVILKILLERNILKEKDVLILDEPEIHLHPKWQMQYAQIIVLLQKFFDLSIIVTTHSADFLAAIEYYDKKHKNIDKCKFYLAKNEDNFNTFVDVTKETEEIYKQMFIPKFHLDELNYELEENEDE